MSDLEKGRKADPNTFDLTRLGRLGSQVEIRGTFSCSSGIKGRFFLPQLFLKSNQIKANLQFSSSFSP